MTFAHTQWGPYLLMAIFLLGIAGAAEARPNRHDRKQVRHFDNGRQAAYRHYHPLGYRLNRLPAGYLTLRYSGSNVFYHSGAYYRRLGQDFVVIRPPLGIGISILPAGYRSHRFRNLSYYSANGVFYRWNDFNRHYVVIDDPRAGENSAPVATEVAEQFVYPRQGQDATQTSRDRYECYLWAVEQSGVEPSQVINSSPATSIESYQRANGACLEARGYSVK